MKVTQTKPFLHILIMDRNKEDLGGWIMKESDKVFYKKKSVKCIFSLSSISPGDQIDKNTLEEFGREILKLNNPPNSLYSGKILQKKSKQKPAKPDKPIKAGKLEKKQMSLDAKYDESCESHCDDLDHPSHAKRCILIGRKFVSLEEKLEIDSRLRFSSSRNISQLYTFSFLVLNLGKHRVDIRLQISPDNKRWLNDSPEVTIEPSDIVAITANNFASYTRLALSSTRCGSEIKIWFQGQI